jgi:hypothetical protein
MACPQVLENSSVAHQPSCFGVGFLLCWFTWGLFLCLAPFLWGKFSDPSAVPCYQHVVMVWWFFFNFAVSFDFGCFSLAQEMSFVDCYLLYFRQRFITPLQSTLLPFQPFVCWKFMWRSAPCSPPFSGALTPPSPPCCVLVFSSLFIQLFAFVFVFVLQGGGISLSRRLCWFIPQVGGGILCDACCSLAGLLNVSQAGLELVSGGIGALLFSQCNMAWRSFVQAKVSGCWSFDSFWCFISTKCGTSFSARFLIYGAHVVCFCTLVASLDPDSTWYFKLANLDLTSPKKILPYVSRKM